MHPFVSSYGNEPSHVQLTADEAPASAGYCQFCETQRWTRRLGPSDVNLFSISLHCRKFPYADVLPQCFEMQMLASYVHINHKLRCRLTHMGDKHLSDVFVYI